MKILYGLILVLALSACAQKQSIKTVAPQQVLKAIPVNTPVVVSYKTKSGSSQAVSQQKIFGSNSIQSFSAAKSPEITRSETITIAAAGDVMLGGTATPFLEKQGYDFPFDSTRSILTSADIAIVNLETPLTHTDELLVKKKYRFRNPPEKVIPALQNAGIDIVSLANNHTLDYGYAGLRDTEEALLNGNIAYHGAGQTIADARKAVVLERKGQKIGFLAYSNTFPKEFWAGKNRPGTAFGHERHVRADVKALVDQGVEIIVVSFHWGQEGSTTLRPYQPMLAKAAIDSGADMVIGHHPHVLQEIEEYNGGVILYSLGNYIFGSFSNRVNESAVINVSFKGGEYESLEVTPILVNNFKVHFNPKILSGAAAQKAFNDLKWPSK